MKIEGENSFCSTASAKAVIDLIQYESHAIKPSNWDLSSFTLFFYELILSVYVGAGDNMQSHGLVIDVRQGD